MSLDRQARTAWGILVLCFLYAALRYVVFGTSSAQQLPAWVLNKALALSSLFALALGIRAQGRGDRLAAGRYLALFSQQALLHVLLTLTLFSPAYYSKLYQGLHQGLYQGARLSALGEFAVLAGAVTAVLLVRTSERSRTALLAGLAALLIPLAALGAPGWRAAATWPGGLPPLTLLGFLLTALAFRWVAPRRNLPGGPGPSRRPGGSEDRPMTGFRKSL